MDSIYNILFGNFIKENKKYYIIFFFLVLFSYPVKSILLPKLFGNLFDFIKSGNFDILEAKKKSCIIIFLWIISQSCVCGINYIQTYIVPKYYMYLRTYIFDNILKKYKKNYKTIDPGGIIIKAFELPWASKSLMFRLLNDIVPLSFSIILTIFYFSKVGVRLGLISFKMPKCQIKSQETYNYIKKINDYLNDKLTNMFHIYTSSNIDYEIKSNTFNENKLREKDIDSNLCTSNLKVYLLIVTIICYILYILNYYLDFLENISLEMPGISYQIGVIKDEIEYLKNISNHDNKNNNDNNNINIKEGHILFKNIHFSYDNKKNIYNNFSIEIKPNIKTAILGKSGSGKSTLMKLLLGFYSVNKGEILIDNININNYSLDTLRKNISYVNQNTTLFNNSILYNIQYGNNSSEETIKNLINNLNIWSFFKHLDYNLNKTVGTNGSNLSGGQKQIILILRALLNNNSKVIIMDEPTSALDSKNKKIFIDILSNIKNKTIIIVTHDDKLIEYVDKVIYLQN